MIAHGWFPFFLIPIPMPYWQVPPVPPPPPPAYYVPSPAPYYEPAPPVYKNEERPSDADPYEGQTHIVPGKPSDHSPAHPRSDGMPVDPPPNSRWYYEPGSPSFNH